MTAATQSITRQLISELPPLARQIRTDIIAGAPFNPANVPMPTGDTYRDALGMVILERMVARSTLLGDHFYVMLDAQADMRHICRDRGVLREGDNFIDAACAAATTFPQRLEACLAAHGAVKREPEDGEGHTPWEGLCSHGTRKALLLALLGPEINFPDGSFMNATSALSARAWAVAVLKIVPTAPALVMGGATPDQITDSFPSGREVFLQVLMTMGVTREVAEYAGELHVIAHMNRVAFV